ncbi:hypothetical protein MH215_05345 [Paenibacillus sp. ACRSA]|uniref:CdiA C-terminal domain-containing protein n=1 Tax=Paenibacillus sp. ACRSA TaxID=2918211 RepID=UPI001EF5DA4B|nr:hypothetical protein [Paenibacillus sp. ACRSA]MCG7376409.1 hypothetical protein [Paenibacillus sp. ACRSA]
MLDDLGVALMFVNLAILAKHGLNKAADKLINSKNMSALDSNWTAWKQQAKTNLNKTAGNITDVASDTLNRAKNRLPGSKLAMDGSPHVSFSKPTKPLPQNSRQQNFWKETEAGKGDLARKLDGGTGEESFTPSQAEGGGHWGNPGQITMPVNPSDSNAQARGYKTTIRENMDEETKRSLFRENEAAEILSRNGYDVEQNPKILDTNKDPDYLINGTIFDFYSPQGETSSRGIASQLEKKKIKKGQTRRIVLNLGDWNGDINELKQQFTEWPIMNLDEVIVVTKDKNVIHLIP